MSHVVYYDFMNVKYLRILITLTIALCCISPAHAGLYSYSRDHTVLGMSRNYTVKGDESLIEIARRFDMGYNEIVAANPRLDPFIPGNGKTVKLSMAWILPDLREYDGIVLNLSEMRLYYFLRKSKSNVVMTFPIGIGSEGKETPIGTFKIIEKIVNPVWHVPASIRKEKPELPAVVPAGPDNPLGAYAMRLSEGTVLIHGTNRPYAVGRKASHGCIRMYPEDIPKLFQSVPNKTKVTIVRQPVKIGMLHNRVYLEVHRDRELNINYFNEAVRLLVEKKLLQDIDKDKMIAVLREKRGIPIDISK
jgi:L,D-transpeptidase ErfK/SrfK